MSRTNRRDRNINVSGQLRKEPDVRRIARAIIALSLDMDETSERFDDLIGTEQVIVTRRRGKRQTPETPDRHEQPNGQRAPTGSGRNRS